MIHRTTIPTISNRTQKMQKLQGGYTAISTILVILVIITAISTTVTLSSIDDLQSSFAQLQGNQAQALTESCIADALLRLNTQNSLPTTVTLPQGSCTVTLDSQLGNDWTFTTTGTFDTYTQSIQVTANRSSTVAITSWQRL